MYLYHFMTRKNKIPIGSKFLPNISISYLKKCNSKEKESKAKMRLLCCIQRKQGRTFTEITQSLNVASATLSDWLLRIQDGGLKSRYDVKKQGRQCWMSPKQLNQLRKDLMQSPENHGFASTVWSTRMIVQYVKNKYGFSYVARSMQDLLHRIGFSSKKPRPIHHKSASKEVKNRFKKTQKGQSKNTQNQGTPRFAWMSHHTE